MARKSHGSNRPKANRPANGRPAETPRPAAKAPVPSRAAPPPAKPAPLPGVVLSPEQLRRRRARSIAIASVLGFLVILFYVVTIVKLGPGVVLNRPL